MYYHNPNILKGSLMSLKMYSSRCNKQIFRLNVSVPVSMGNKGWYRGEGFRDAAVVWQYMTQQCVNVVGSKVICQEKLLVSSFFPSRYQCDLHSIIGWLSVPIWDVWEGMRSKSVYDSRKDEASGNNCVYMSIQLKIQCCTSCCQLSVDIEKSVGKRFGKWGKCVIGRQWWGGHGGHLWWPPPDNYVCLTVSWLSYCGKQGLWNDLHTYSIYITQSFSKEDQTLVKQDLKS